jgi:ectoine hydroxylase-related dioxygenase (phytanoyl-CoA dioxygenase family)
VVDPRRFGDNREHRSGGQAMQAARLEAHLKAVEENGFTILEEIAPPHQVAALRERVRAIEAETAGTPEELADDPEHSFLRTAGLLRLDPMFREVPIQSDVLEVVEGVLGEDFLLSTFSALDVEPHKSTRPPLHPDDARIPLGRPHERPIGCTCMWVITEFSAQSGGTRLIPGSHRAPLDLLFSQDAAAMEGLIQPDIAPGSVLVFDHALFHGAADNHSDAWRLGLQVSYHAGWIRPYTNWFRSIPVEEVATYPRRLADLLGYKTYRGIGSQNTQQGSYRESYAKMGSARDPRLPLR